MDTQGKLRIRMEKLGKRMEKLGKRMEKLGKRILQNLVKPLEKQRNINESRSPQKSVPIGMHFCANRIARLLQKP